ncbi:MAG: hypothetical protein ACI8RZ_003862 [Myxococcota bacterium]|jgi:hypothetical protein
MPVARNSIRLLMLSSLFLAGATASADDTTNPDFIPEAVEGVGDDANTGWTPFLSTGGNLSYATSKGVVGAADGATFTGGLILNGGLNFLDAKERHEWTTTVGWNLAYTNTPTVPVFVKSADILSLQSTWLYHLPKAPWVGPFADVRMTSAVFPGYLVSGADVEVQRLNVDGTSGSLDSLAAIEQYGLTTGFSPTTLRESAGVFVQPISKDIVTIEARAGLGAWESFVRDGYYVADDDTTETIEVQQMQDSVQVGSEINVAANGAVNELISYTTSASLMLPFVNNADTDLTGTELLNQEYTAGLSLKLSKFAALQYQFSAVNTPLVVNAWQINNALLLSFSANLVGEGS